MTTGYRRDLVRGLEFRDSDQDKVMRGSVAAGRFSSTSNGSTFTASTTTDFVISNYVARANRQYEVWLKSSYSMSAAIGQWDLAFRVGGSQVDLFGKITNQTAAAITLGGLWVVAWSPGAGTFNLDMRANEISGATDVTFTASGTDIRRMWVVDAGPT